MVLNKDASLFIPISQHWTHEISPSFQLPLRQVIRVIFLPDYLVAIYLFGEAPWKGVGIVRESPFHDTNIRELQVFFLF